MVELCRLIGCSESTLWKAGRRGDLKFRTKSDAAKLAIRLGKSNPQTLGRNSKEKISKSVNNRIESGTWHVSLAKNMWKEYNGMKFHGSWEVEYAKWLDRNSIRWRKPTETFRYTFQGKVKRYTPDFYLIDDQTYIEVKGYETEKDRAKWAQFPLKHRVLKKKDLVDMGISVK